MQINAGRKSINYWAICCPGPSLSRRETIIEMMKSNPDYIIAVNGAILQDVPFDYWAVQDIEVFRSICEVGDVDLSSVRLWIPERWVADMNAYHPDLLNQFNKMDRDTFPSDRVEHFSMMMPFGRNLNWREFTMITAIGLAVREGAELIRIYGADLSGSGYFRPGLNNERTIHNDRRWDRELERLEEVTLEAGKHGIKIVREVFNNASH